MPPRTWSDEAVAALIWTTEVSLSGTVDHNGAPIQISDWGRVRAVMSALGFGHITLNGLQSKASNMKQDSAQMQAKVRRWRLLAQEMADTFGHRLIAVNAAADAADAASGPAGDTAPFAGGPAVAGAPVSGAAGVAGGVAGAPVAGAAAGGAAAAVVSDRAAEAPEAPVGGAI